MLARVTKNALSKTAQPVFRFRGRLRTKVATSIQLNPRTPARAASTITLPPTSDDRDLVAFFDVPSSNSPSSGTSTGIFGHPSLTSPQALESIADAILKRARLLTERVLRAPQSRSEMFKVVKNLDRLSDLLCSVVDLAEFVRNAHPDPKWVASANKLYENLSEFMNVLNTHVGLYNVCCKMLCLPLRTLIQPLGIGLKSCLR